MTFAVIVSIIFIVGSVTYIAFLFNRDHKIRSQGRDILALVEEVHYLSSNDNVATNIKYRLSWRESGVDKHVEGKDTIPAFYSSKVQKGSEVYIKYLDDDHVLFVFDK